MDQKRKKLYDVIERAAKNKGNGSKWDLNRSKKLEIDIAPPKSTFALNRETSK
jgi:hypothetical protein|tara:strand:- start:3471 stop:3629 length:159 start_codon:yes stop_codon:yes gene_type:complete